jgi:hypothetical protein
MPLLPRWRRLLPTLLVALMLAGLGQVPAAAGERRDWLIIPALGYSSDTQWMGGGILMRFYGCAQDSADSDCRRSHLSLALLYSQKQQLVAKLGGDNRWDARRLLWSLSYRRFPSTFYGLGRAATLEEGYTPLALAGELSGLQRLGAGWELGLAARASRQRLEDLEPGGSLAGGGIPGSEAHALVGLGPRAVFDRRDRPWYPSRGLYLSAGATFYRRALGGDRDTERYGLELRSFRSLGGGLILAGQLALDAVVGSAPFQLLPALGGDEDLRGYPGGRYRDRNRFLAQLELRRAALLGPFGLVCFGAMGDVAPALAQLAPGRARLAAGFGLRYRHDPQSGLSLRADFGYGEDGERGLAIALGEAF